jgi:CopG family nickel-responsive transcriptional regulator
MNQLIRFGISIESTLLEKFDRHIWEHTYTNRSEAIRDLIRKELVQQEWEQSDQESLGTITLIYDHHVRELPELLTEIQHSFHANIISALHVHLDPHNCMEVLAVRGKPPLLREIADHLLSLKGVKHGKLVMTTTGQGV